MVYDVAFSVVTFKRLPDDTQVKVPKTEVISEVIAESDNAAVAVAASRLREEDWPEDVLGAATVTLRKF